MITNDVTHTKIGHFPNFSLVIDAAALMLNRLADWIAKNISYEKNYLSDVIEIKNDIILTEKFLNIMTKTKESFFQEILMVIH